MPQYQHRPIDRSGLTNTDRSIAQALEVEFNLQSSMEKPQQHILIASYPAQGHINPTLRLAKCLAREAGVRITFSTAVNAHRRMFPNQEAVVLQEDLFSYIPYSNGYDDGFDPKKHDSRTYMSDINKQGSITLAAMIDDLATQGRPVTCIIYSFMSWVAGIARERGIPSFLFWIQPATAFAVYLHCFHNYESILAAKLKDPSNVINFPGLPPMSIRDLPSFLTETSPDDHYAAILPIIRDMFEMLNTEIVRQTSKLPVIANTADEMEASAIVSVADKVNIIGIGPLLEDTVEGSLFKSDDKNEYMDWLDGQAEGSVVYVSFGSISVLKQEQVEEIWKGLRESGRSYLWVVRKDNRWEGLELEKEEKDKDLKKGMVVEWCSQGRVLRHKAVGCFVTHCGWNSTVESLLCGVPTVAVPQWTDQLTNAWLMEKAWETGVRAEVNKDGLMEAEELRQCLEIVMGEGERPDEIRRKAEIWKGRGRRATVEGGSSHKNLKAFVEGIAS